MPNSGESLFGFKHSSSNLNLSSKISNKLFSSWGESALATYLSDQIVKYPYTFVTGSLKYGALSNDPNKFENMWKVGFGQANMGALYDFGGMAYQSSVNMHYKLYQAERNYQMSLELSIQKARANTPGNNYNLNYNLPVQNYFYMPSVSPYFYMNLNINN